MTGYEINKLCYLADRDPALRAALRTEPSTIDSWGLTGEERDAIRAGRVDVLFELGAHPVLLLRLLRHGLFGITEASYVEQMRAVAE